MEEDNEENTSQPSVSLRFGEVEVSKEKCVICNFVLLGNSLKFAI